MDNMAWMAWTWQTGLFFAIIAALLCAMTLWERLSPSVERRGVLGITTTRGDRLFISLLGAAFIQLAWLGLVGPSLWGALAISLVYAMAVFRLA
jgi:predicted small integral membrane protein